MDKLKDEIMPKPKADPPTSTKRRRRKLRKLRR